MKLRQKLNVEWCRLGVTAAGVVIIPMVLWILATWQRHQELKIEESREQAHLKVEYIKTFYSDLLSQSRDRRIVSVGVLCHLDSEFTDNVLAAIQHVSSSRSLTVGIAADMAAMSCLSRGFRRKSDQIRQSIQDGLQISVVDGISPNEHRLPFITVGLMADLRGRTPFPELNHYLLVAPQKRGIESDDVQDQPVELAADGTWSGRAKFGEAGARAGEIFQVRLIATRVQLPPGPVTGLLPDDALSSNSVIVKRSR